MTFLARNSRVVGNVVEFEFDSHMEAFAELRRLRMFVGRVAGLNVAAGEIGAGMLAQLVDEAKRIEGKSE